MEGTESSLDFPLYSALFPGISVVSKDGCSDVERAVYGIQNTQNHHHAIAFGLIDRDDRSDEKVVKLSEKKYFCPECLLG